MFGYLAVKYYKNLAEEEKDVKAYGIGNNFGKRLNLLPSRIKLCHAADDKA
jgi:hypothetical protein